MINLRDEGVIGIVGGMGPQAGIALFNAILSATKATTDQEHLSVMLMSFPSHIVDRTSFLEGHTEINPAFNIAEIITKLGHAGASIIGIACNTSYCPGIYDVIKEELLKKSSRVKLLHMPLETCDYIKKNYPYTRRVGIMTTNGTYKSGIYKKLLKQLGYEVIIPEWEFQDGVIHRMIYDAEFGIKPHAGTITEQVEQLMEKALTFFRKNGAEVVILGCTDLSSVMTGRETNAPVIVDSTEALAVALIREATAIKRRETYI